MSIPEHRRETCVYVRNAIKRLQTKRFARKGKDKQDCCAIFPKFAKAKDKQSIKLINSWIFAFRGYQASGATIFRIFRACLFPSETEYFSV